MSYSKQLEVALIAARRAGELIRADFHRDGGPRGSGGKAPVDAEAERVIRQTLDAAFPDYGFIGEELPGLDRAPAKSSHVWLVDPNDGTASFLKGWRGSAVSIGLLHESKLVLGVVFAPLAPDDNGDLFSWAEGESLLRNRRPVTVVPSAAPGKNSVVLVSQDADRKSAANAESVAPARFRSMPSIAYRLALVAAGGADAALSLNSPGAIDVAGGHALLLGAGLDLFAFDGQPVRYSRSGSMSHGGNCIAGSSAIAAVLSKRDLLGVLRAPADPEPEWPLVWPQKGQAMADAGVLARAQGCLLGQCSGDALGQLVEFRSAAEIARPYPNGVRELADGGAFNTLAGQPTDDSELALMLARSIVKAGHYDAESAAQAYAWWLGSHPFDVGNTTRAALGPALAAAKAGKSAAAAARKAASMSSQANGALMRLSPLAIFAWSRKPEETAKLAREDAALTHPDPVCRDANAVFAIAVAHAIKTGAEPAAVFEFARDWASKSKCRPDVLVTLEAAREAAPKCDGQNIGWVRVALQNAFYELLHTRNLEEALVHTVGRGGDTDTNSAITGALLGAVHSRDAVPQRWRNLVLTCRPLSTASGAKHPRPKPLWPVDLLLLAERLLVLGGA